MAGSGPGPAKSVAASFGRHRSPSHQSIFRKAAYAVRTHGSWHSPPLPKRPAIGCQ